MINNLENGPNKDVPQFVQDCLAVVKEGKHTEGDQDGYCWALYNKHAKGIPDIKFDKTKHLESTELETIVSKRLEARGHSNPTIGVQKINIT